MRGVRGSRSVTVVADTRARAETAARTLLGRGGARNAHLVSADSPSWPDELDPSGPGADRDAVFAAGSRAELRRLILAAHLVGNAERVMVAILPDGLVVDIPLLSVPVPGAAEIRQSSELGMASVTVTLHTPGPAVDVLRAVAMLPGDLRRGAGAGGLQVAVAGRAGYPWVVGDARALPVQPSMIGRLHNAAGRHLDVLFVDGSWCGGDALRLKALVAEAQEVGAKVIGHPGPHDGWRDLVDAEARFDEASPGPDGVGPVAVSPFPPVDIAVVNPSGFQVEADDVLVAMPTRGGPLPAAVQSLDATVDVRPWTPGAALSMADLHRLRPHRAVVDHPAMHADAVAHAGLLAQLGTAGVPVLAAGDLPAEVVDLLGAPLARAITRSGAEELADPLLRESRSVEQRRAALLAHGPQPRWRELRDRLGLPLAHELTISVLMATNRPELLDHMAAQLNRQDHPRREAVFVLHGDGFDDKAEAWLAERVDGPVSVRRLPAERSLGEALNVATEASSGELVAKMDDDDWYGPHHLSDLEMAWRYSGAAMVGKAAEFVHLEDIDLTIRRFVGGGESFNDRVAGGTLLLARDDLAQAGGWRRARRAVDRLLIADVRTAGGDVYRTHGFEFVLQRRPGGHTWDAETGYFLRQSKWQQRGRALDLAGVR